MDEFTRRRFLAAAAVLPAAGLLRGQEPAGRVVRVHEPRNLESPFARTDALVTPTDRFYVRSHFATPTLDAATYRLTVEGVGPQPVALLLEDLAKLPRVNRPATLECAGNGRVYLVPRAKGVAWGLGAVATAEWGGVSLRSVLERAGWRDGQPFDSVVLEGADRGSVNDDPKTPGAIQYARSLPMAKALAPETLLADRMNGEPLRPDHGFPLRAVVAGWYGMASVKWLTRIVVRATPARTYWETMDYAVYERTNGLPALVPLAAMQVKSSVARPEADEVVPAGKPYRVHGAAWAGEADVADVAVSADGGRSWQPARLLGEANPHCWRLWELTWQVPRAAGRYRLMARATDTRGRSQPLDRDPDRMTYMVTHVVPVPVEVR